MRPLIIDYNIRMLADAVIEYAEENPFSMDDLLDIKNGEMKSAGDMEEYTFTIPHGYRVVFSIKHQNKTVKHLSVSVDAKDKLPHEIAVRQIMELMGMETPLEKCVVVIEDLPNRMQAINVLEVIKN